MKLPTLSPEKVTSTNVNYEFVANVALRFFKVMFRTDKKIKLIYSNYSDKHFLGGNFIVLNYRFRNALWYKVDDVSTDKRQLIVSRPDSVKKMNLIVYGFFSKKVFTLNFEEKFDTSNFCREEKYSIPA